MTFSDEELKRYHRQILLENIGTHGQQLLKKAKVIVVGAGGLGSPVAYYLAAAGIGTLAIADGDRVDISNLQRQILHSSADIGRMKVESACEKLMRLNPDIRLEPYGEFLSYDKAVTLFSHYDFVLECSDNFTTKYMVNDACIASEKPFSLGGIRMMGGQAMTHITGSACYRCLFPLMPDPATVPDSSSVGVLGAAVGIIGSIQATETIKYLTDSGTLLTNRLLTVDALSMKFDTFDFSRNSNCPTCGKTTE